MINPKTISRILYVIVLPEESSVLLDQGKFVKEEDKSKEYANILEAYVHNDNGNEIIIVRPVVDPLHCTSLFGTEIAFFLTYTGIKLFSPDVVINMGYAGEVALDDQDDKILGIGSVVIAKERSVYHRREMLIKFYENTSQGLYPVLSCDKMTKEYGFHSHTVGTSNSFVVHDEKAKCKKVKVVEMELCSVARACLYFNTYCLGVKIISDGGAKDLTDEQRIKQFLDSLPLLREKFFDTYEKVNKFLFGKVAEEL